MKAALKRAAFFYAFWGTESLKMGTESMKKVKNWGQSQINR